MGQMTADRAPAPRPAPRSPKTPRRVSWGRSWELTRKRAAHGEYCQHLRLFAEQTGVPKHCSASHVAGREHGEFWQQRFIDNDHDERAPRLSKVATSKPARRAER